MDTGKKADGGPEPTETKPKPKGLAVGALLLPLGVAGGAALGAHLMRERAGSGELVSWLVGGPLGAAAGVLAAFAVLVVLNAALRAAGRR